MLQRRTETRVSPSAPFWVYDRNGHKPIGRLEDFTTEGIRLSSDNLIQPGTILPCKMAVPEEVNKSGSITFDAKSIWSKKHPDSNKYHTGFMLLNVIRGEIERLKNLQASSVSNQ